MDIRAECIGSLAFDQWAKVKELDMWDRLFSIGALRRVLSSTPIRMEFHCLGFPHHFKNEFHMSHNVPLHFFFEVALYCQTSFLFFFELEGST